MPHYQLHGEAEVAQAFAESVIAPLLLDLLFVKSQFSVECREHGQPCWAFDLLSGDFPFALESREHELLALLAYLSLDDAVSSLHQHSILSRWLVCTLCNRHSDLLHVRNIK